MDNEIKKYYTTSIVFFYMNIVRSVINDIIILKLKVIDKLLQAHAQSYIELY